MGMFNNLNTAPGVYTTKENNKEIKTIVRPTYYLSYQRKTTDSGLSRWIDDNNFQRGFQLNDGNVTVLNSCILLVIVDGIKQKSGLAEIKMKINNKIIRSYDEKTKKKLNFLRLTYAGEFNENDVITIETINIIDTQLTIFGQ